MKYIIDNDPNYDYSQFGLSDVGRMQSIDPGNISTFHGDFSNFRARGGKIVTYHGRADDVRIINAPTPLLYPCTDNVLVAHPIRKRKGSVQSRLEGAWPATFITR